MLPGFDYLTNYSDWLSVQNGVVPPTTTGYDPVRRYVRSGRDLRIRTGNDFNFLRRRARFIGHVASSTKGLAARWCSR